MRPQDVKRFTEAKIKADETYQRAEEAKKDLEKIRREVAGSSESEGTPVERFDKMWDVLQELIKPYLPQELRGDHISGNTDLRIVACPTEEGSQDFGVWFSISGQEEVDPPNRRIQAEWLKWGENGPSSADFIEVVVRDPVLSYGEDDLKTMADLGNMETTLLAYLGSERIIELPLEPST